ncbi:MAG: NHLP family bacteriocin export ABC transporter peptidase/permease/ATPase subunit [Lachnospiraceae bacterium]|nr:NHLP family bacteriocin export ABC transporter peptidase/permease/ATPase subunit [Lachnospiraceae bacterium]
MVNKMGTGRKPKQIAYGQRPAKVPVVMQLEIMECGAASLAMILAYYGKWITLEEAREDCGVSRDGQNALNIVKAARNYGFDCKGYSMAIDGFKSFKEFPCIVHWGFNHFVVVTGIRGNKVYINDPGIGQRAISWNEFDENYTGIVLTMKPTDDFVPGGKQRSMFDFAKKQLKGTAVIVTLAIITTIITNLFGIINPIFSKVFVDRLLTGRNPEWLYPFIVLLALVNVASITASIIGRISTLRINGKMAVVGSSSFMWKALHLPMKFYSQRMVGDIQSRQNSSANISTTLINTFAPLLLDSVMMVFYLGVMLRQSVLLSLFGLASICINYAVSGVISKKRLNMTRGAIRDTGKLYSTEIAGIEMIETIKASGSEVGYFERWAGYQALVNTAEIKSMKIEQGIGLIPSIVSIVTNNVVLICGIMLVLNGQFTCGSVMAFQGLVNSFMAPAVSIISANQKLTEMRTEVERLEDVMEYPSDERAVEPEYSKDEKISFDKLSGKIEMKDVTFGYSALAKPLIENFNLTLMPGSKIAFVGRSGCGKSTLTKLISGLYKPWSGQILFDGIPIEQIDKNKLRSSLAVVDQDIILFNDSIKDNIRMWDKSIKDFEVILAARDAQIYEDIINRPGGFDYVIDENGNDLSGGQKQRIEIARTLAQDPTIVILDEATSALDAITEGNVVKSINDRGVSCIVVAHRLSTVRDCDEIIVMDKGKVVDRGTHEELMSRGGLYKEIVSSEDA